MRVTRKQIIKALRTEPLGAQGNFIQGTDKTCRVCAVGAVLRATYKDDDKVWRIGEELVRGTYVSGNYHPYNGYTGSEKRKVVEAACAEQALTNPLAALSSLYEYRLQKMMTTRITKALRESLVNFVKKHFPKEVTVPR